MNDLKSIKPSFDAMPQMVAEILEENRTMAVMIRRMSKQLCDIESSRKDKNEDVRMDVKELCNYLPNHPAEQTIYGWTSKGKFRIIKYLSISTSASLRLISGWSMADISQMTSSLMRPRNM